MCVIGKTSYPTKCVVLTAVRTRRRSCILHSVRLRQFGIGQLFYIMERRYIASIILVLINAVTCQDDYGDDSADSASVVYSDTTYDTSREYPLNLQGSLRQRMALNGAIADPGKSFVCSPISALLPLGKLVLGATGPCETELREAIGAPSTKDVQSSFKSLLQNLKSLSGVKLTVCSRIYVNKEYRLLPEFEKDAREVFNSSIKKINIKQPANVAKRINNWASVCTEVPVSDEIDVRMQIIASRVQQLVLFRFLRDRVKRKTLGMIPEIIRPNAISPSSSLILVNAVYFSGTWKKRFRKVEIRDFYTATSTRKVPMMTRDGSYKYSKNDALDCQMIEIPYTGGHASFVIFLPNTKDGLPLLLYKLKLAPELMQTGIQKMQTESVILSIPKFKTSTDLDLKVSYEKLGLKEILRTEGSGLNKIVKGDKNLYVSKAIQKAVIDVNENGTTAAAASVVMVVGAAWNPTKTKKIFNADRPFIYLVQIKKEITFFGTYVD